jgi:hypothetical protein
MAKGATFHPTKDAIEELGNFFTVEGAHQKGQSESDREEGALEILPPLLKACGW